MTQYTEVNLFGIEFGNTKFKTMFYRTTKSFCQNLSAHELEKNEEEKDVNTPADQRMTELLM